MNNADLVDLDPETQTRLEQLLTRSGSLHRPATILPDTGEILRYLCGALGPGEARALERGMNASADARRRLREAHSALARLQSISWDEVTREATHDPTAHAWRRIAAERARVLAQTSLPGRAADWTGLCKRAAEGLVEAQAALTRLRALGEHLTGMWLGGTGLAAATRGARPPLFTVDGLPVRASSLDLTAAIDAEGTLVARMQFRAFALPPDIDISGRSADLTLYSAGSTLVVGSSIAAEQSIEWRIAGLGTVLGLSAEPLPSEAFCISIGDPPPTEFESDTGLFLVGAVIEPSGEPTPGDGPLFPQSEPPVWDSGQVHLALVLDSVTRIAYSDYQLALDVNIFVQRWQRLGSWPIKDLQAGVNRLAAPFLGDYEFGGAFDLPLRIQLLPTSP